MPLYRQPSSIGKYTTKPPVCQGFCVIFASPVKQAFVKYFNNSNFQLLNFKEGFSQKMGCAIRKQALLRPGGSFIPIRQQSADEIAQQAAWRFHLLA